MSIRQSSLSGSLSAGSGPTLADVLARVPSLDASKQARMNMASSLRTLARVLDCDLRHVAIHTPTLRRVLETASPGAVGVSPSRWRNVKADVHRAIRLSGLSTIIKAPLGPISDAWQQLASLVSTRTDLHALLRFGRFCSSLPCPPEAVSADTLDAYLADLEQTQLSKNPQVTVRTLIRVWNGKISKAHPDLYTALPNPASKVTYGPAWQDLPDAFVQDAERFREASLKPNLFAAVGAARPITESTANQRHAMIRRIAAAEVLSGVSVDELQSLAALVAPARLKLALTFFVGRNNGTPSVQSFEAANLALAIARHWARLPEDEIDQIQHWAYKLRPRAKGMTEKNRQRLGQFTNPDVIRRLLTLPDTLMATAKKLPVNVHSALLVQKAIAIAILQVAPIRVGNLGILNRSTHFRRAFSTGAPIHHLFIPAEDVKNNVDLEFPIPGWVMALIDTYMRDYQPLLCRGYASQFLFPGVSGGPKEGSGLRRDITDTVRKHTGIHMNAHLFRHLAAYIYLTERPGEHESVRQLLGHKRMATTVNFYAGFEADAAMRRYTDLLEGYRAPPTQGGAE